ncbi:MAG TPA: metallophosphoesterase [Nitrososphaeraceae archaeon]
MENARLSRLSGLLLISSWAGYLMVNSKQVALLTLLTCLLLDNVLFFTQSEGANELGSKVSRQFNFVAAGDFGCSAEANRTVTDMVKKNPQIVLALGDLSYDRSPNCWLDTISPLDSRGKVKIAFGDHDMTNELFKYDTYLKHFNLTKPYYSFNHNNVHFLAMATAKNNIIPYAVNSQQYEFVRNDLKMAHENKSIDWIIVYSFRPFYSSNTTHPAEEQLRDFYHSLFDTYGVDLVLQAHNHNYQRTYPITFNNPSPSYPTISDKQKYNFSNPKAPIFVTVGTAGAPLYNFSSQSPNTITQLAQYGFLNVDIEKLQKSNTLTGTFYNNNLNKLDNFTITK